METGQSLLVVAAEGYDRLEELLTGRPAQDGA